MDTRPRLNEHISPKDFREFYWLKEELIKFCRVEGLRISGSKIEITQRIDKFLQTGGKEQIKTNSRPKSTSKFDWNNEKLSLTTKITDNYKSTENVRAFFEQQIGTHFKFNVKFMNWMKTNTGKTLKAAIEEWGKIKTQKKHNTQAKDIAPQFEYNRYLRDFLADNPNSSREVGIKLWKIKKSKRGDNIYRKDDLKWIDKIYE